MPSNEIFTDLFSTWIMQLEIDLFSFLYPIPQLLGEIQQHNIIILDNDDEIMIQLA